MRSHCDFSHNWGPSKPSMGALCGFASVKVLATRTRRAVKENFIFSLGSEFWGGERFREGWQIDNELGRFGVDDLETIALGGFVECLAVDDEALTTAVNRMQKRTD